MARPSASYEPRRPAGSVVHRIVEDHLETFLAEAAGLRDGEGVPQFVERAFRDFLRCGSLAGGFARFRCGNCGLDQLVAFSCKGRTVCPSCGGRRMPPSRDLSAIARSAEVEALAEAGRNVPRIWWTTSSQTSPSDSGS